MRRGKSFSDMRNFKFIITNEVSNLGAKTLAVWITGIKNDKLNPKLDKYIKLELEKIKKYWKNISYKEDLILQGFRDLHTKVGRSNRDFPASPEVLLKSLLERDRFPRINSIVDIYNLVSVKTRLALGAHDINFIKGNITLRLTQGNENFLPLGATKSVSIPAGEYAYIDDENIICRLEVLQAETTKITLDTTDVFLIIQGNPNTSSFYVEQGALEVIDLILKFCGGEYTYLNSLN